MTFKILNEANFHLSLLSIIVPILLQRKTKRDYKSKNVVTENVIKW